MKIGLRGLAVALLLAFTAPRAEAAIDISFYSHEWGDRFPHAFVLLRGVDDRTGAPVDATYGFTASNVSPAVLMGSVKGKIVSSKPAYVAQSDPHFRFALSGPEYDRVLATVDKWRTLKQPSYNLNRRNCVFFVADMAAVLGMAADTPKALMKKPRSYIESLSRANRDWLRARGAIQLRAPPALPPARRRAPA